MLHTFHRWSLSFCFLALLLGFWSFGFSPEFVQQLHWQGSSFLWRATLAVSATLVLSVAALCNLLAAEARGYSPSRSRLAVVSLAFGIALAFPTGMRILQHIRDFH